MAVEINHVAYGSRARARRDAVAQIRARLDAEVPGARLLALLDGSSPRRPEPVLRLAQGRHPRLLLVDDDERNAPGYLFDRVSRVWDLPAGRYAAPRVPEPLDRRPVVALIAAGSVLALPLMLSVLLPAPIAPGVLSITRLWRGGVPVVVAFSVSVLLTVGVLVVARRRRWTGDRTWRTAAAPLLPSCAVGVVIVLVNGVQLVGLAFPAVVAAVLAALCVAAIPVLVSRIQRPVLWAVLAWGLPLLGGGVAPFVGALVVHGYLAPFGLDAGDVELLWWTQWTVGAAATAVVLLGAYVGVAFWAVATRMGSAPAGIVFGALIAAVYLVSALQVVVTAIDTRARPGPGGVPGPLAGLTPALVCVETLQQPFSYIGAGAPLPGEAAIYFGRSDGRAALWSAASGGVLVDEQAVSLRVVQDATACRPPTAP